MGNGWGAVNATVSQASDDSIVGHCGSGHSNDGMAQSRPAHMEFKIPTTAQGLPHFGRTTCNNDNPYLFQLRACDDPLRCPYKYSVEELGIKKVMGYA